MPVHTAESSPLEALERLYGRLARYMSEEDLNLVNRAYGFAAQAHARQTRDSGEPFIMHPLGTSQILAELEMDAEAIAAAILHDVEEDTAVRPAQVRATFGDGVARLVEGLTKLRILPLESVEQKKAEALRRMFVTMAKDLRVVVIKLADRLHNMRTLDSLPRAKQIKIARETLDIYAPLAHRLGISQIKWELEDLAFRVLEPDGYAFLKQAVAKKRAHREKQIEEIVKILKKEFRKAKIPADITGRPKHLYSIWQKMQRQGKSFSEIYDVNAVRIIVDTPRRCYEALGLVQGLWKHIPGTFDDYISVPKSNGYQSLHTAVIGEGGEPLEIQIRTYEMHHRSEFGVAAHWKYKEGKLHRERFEDRLSWLRQLWEWHKEFQDSAEYVRSVQLDYLTDEVFCFTPKGDVVELPQGATCVDFAYRIHTEIGHRCMGAKVNGKMTPLDYALQNGDIVEILTASTPKPSLDWLHFAKTASAKAKIRQFFKRQRREELVASGRRAVDFELSKMEHALTKDEKHRFLDDVSETYQLKSGDDLLMQVGAGEVRAATVADKIYRLSGKASSPASLEEIRPIRRKVRSGDGILVENMNGILVHLSKCCAPVPGDPIVGFVSRGYGVSVHRQDCAQMRQTADGERLVRVEWDYEKHLVCPVELLVESEDRVGLLSEISGCAKEASVNVQSAKMKTAGGKVDLRMVVEVGSAGSLEKLIRRIQQIQGVWQVSRK